MKPMLLPLDDASLERCLCPLVPLLPPAGPLGRDQIPGNPPLNLVAAWALQPEWLSPDCPERLRRFFDVFYCFIDIPLSSSLPPTSSPAVPKTSPVSPSSSRGTADEKGRGNASEQAFPLGLRPSLPVVVAAASEKRMGSAAAAARVDREGGGGEIVGTGGGRGDGVIGVSQHGVGRLEPGGRAGAGRRQEEGGRETPSPVRVGGGDVSGTSTTDREYPWQSSDDESEAGKSVSVSSIGENRMCRGPFTGGVAAVGLELKVR